MELDTEYPFKTFSIIGDNQCSELKQSIKNIIEEESYVSCSVNGKVLEPDGGNLLAILCEVNVEGKTSKGHKETNIFIKIITPGDKLTVISLPDSYKRELFFYQELAEIFAKLQTEVSIPFEERYKTVKSYKESSQKLIILENMSKKGFKTNSRKDLITLQYAEMAIRELAKFHALSFVLETQRPKYFERKIKAISKTYTFNEDWDGFVENMCQITLNYLEGESRRKFEDLIPSFGEKYRKYLESGIGRLCLRHGDYRPNNILVKETNGKITEMIPIDYQLISYACPVLDFMYFIFPATDRKLRKTHLHYLKNLYHQSLQSFLKYFSLDVENIYPRKDYERDFKEMLDFGLMVSINLVPFLMASDDDIPDITNQPLAGLSFCVDAKCKERLVGIVDDFIEWGYL